jgi:hypothetical protein
MPKDMYNVYKNVHNRPKVATYQVPHGGQWEEIMQLCIHGNTFWQF